MARCWKCEKPLTVTELQCSGCKVTMSGTFATSRLARLNGAQQKLIEQVILAGGNLKHVAREVDLSYPTFRKRLEAVIEDLANLKREDEACARQLFDEVEAGSRSPEEAARHIREMNGDA